MKIEISEDKSTATIDGVEYNLKRKGKKISEWLQELPDGYRELALANYDEKYSSTQVVKDLKTAIDKFCEWDKTPQGCEFWINVSEYLYGESNSLPPLPNPKFEVWKPKVGESVYFAMFNGEVEDILKRFAELRNNAISGGNYNAPLFQELVNELMAVKSEFKPSLYDFAKSLKNELFKQGITIIGLNLDTFKPKTVSVTPPAKTINLLKYPMKKYLSQSKYTKK